MDIEEIIAVAKAYDDEGSRSFLALPTLERDVAVAYMRRLRFRAIGNRYEVSTTSRTFTGTLLWEDEEILTIAENPQRPLQVSQIWKRQIVSVEPL